MKYRSVFDIIGPVMIGPSSSHTAGAVLIGKAARTLFGNKPKKAEIHFYGSFAQTYRGHGTDVAIVGGIMNFDTFDKRIVNSLEIARKEGIDVTLTPEEEEAEHPNTARVVLSDDENRVELTGISVGGGKIEIVNVGGFDIRLSGNSSALLVLHEDRFGMIAAVAQYLAEHEINIGKMEMSRKSKGCQALMVIETDQAVPQPIVKDIAQLDYVDNASVIHP